MFAKEWSLNNCSTNQMNLLPNELPNYTKYIETVAPLMWGEHCVECAVPECYHYCKLYEPREDGRCKLFKSGIQKNNQYNGVLNYGVEITFRNWGKLEAFTNVGQYKLGTIKKIDSFLTACATLTKNVASHLPGGQWKWKLTVAYYKIREGIVLILGKKKKLPQALLIGLVNNEEDFKLIVEVKTLTESKFRTSVVAQKGYSQYIIPYEQLNISNEERHYIFVYPESKEKETTVTFTALDLVRFSSPIPQPVTEDIQAPAEKVKCVVWDLDQTLWSGILIENDVVVPNPEVINIIKALDERGILNAICSKNDFDSAYEKLKAFGLEEYFVDMQINWDPKSINLKQIAKNLNIGIDTFAFIDDSPFERSEVSHSLPMVRCYDPLNISDLLVQEAFNVPVTADSKQRRNTYKMLEQRRKKQESWTGNIDDFLRSCEMCLTLGKPHDDEVMRCFELLQRTNQLNISGRRLPLEDVKNLIHHPKIESYVMICSDTFGNYGIVGFVVISLEQNVPVITDLVISCRVANKKVEHSLILWLAARYKEKNYTSLRVNYKPSKKNGPLSKVFQDLDFKEFTHTDTTTVYELSLQAALQSMDIVKVINRDAQTVVSQNIVG